MENWRRRHTRETSCWTNAEKKKLLGCYLESLNDFLSELLSLRSLEGQKVFFSDSQSRNLRRNNKQNWKLSEKLVLKGEVEPPKNFCGKTCFCGSWISSVNRPSRKTLIDSFFLHFRLNNLRNGTWDNFTWQRAEFSRKLPIHINEDRNLFQNDKSSFIYIGNFRENSAPSQLKMSQVTFPGLFSRYTAKIKKICLRFCGRPIFLGNSALTENGFLKERFGDGASTSPLKTSFRKSFQL